VPTSHAPQLVAFDANARAGCGLELANYLASRLIGKAGVGTIQIAPKLGVQDREQLQC